ncbi:MAG: hypothetical protein HZA91_19920 [Verrucomicrobia bacterium]|nr:hypothetical protein [Verrucomicrobiota bacterium]
MCPARFLFSIVLLDIVVVLSAVARGLSNTGDPSRYFGEGRYVTFVSCAQLLAIGALSFCIYWKRRGGSPSVFGAPLVWFLAACGFVFLAFDEVFEIHEAMDFFIHRAFQITETPFTDRIDDAIIALYGVIGLGVMVISRREVLQFRREMFRPIAAGFAAMLVSVVCDTLSNGYELAVQLTGDPASAKALHDWLSVSDGAFTLLAEAFFVAAFYAGWRQAGAGGGAAAGGAVGLR